MHIRKEHNPNKHRLVALLVTGFTLVIGGIWAYQLKTMVVSRSILDVQDSWQEMVRQYDQGLQYGDKVQQYLPTSDVGEFVESASATAQAQLDEIEKATGEKPLDDLAKALIDGLNTPVDAAQAPVQE